MNYGKEIVNEDVAANADELIQILHDALLEMILKPDQ